MKYKIGDKIVISNVTRPMTRTLYKIQEHYGFLIILDIRGSESLPAYDFVGSEDGWYYIEENSELYRNYATKPKQFKLPNR